MRQVSIPLMSAVVAGVLLGGGALGSSHDEAPGAGADISPDAALAVTDAYFAAYEAGDVAAMLDLFTPDARIVTQAGPFSHAQFELLYTWKRAEGTTFAPRTCSTSASESPPGVVVSCQHGHHEGVAQAVGAGFVPHALTQVITAEGIVEQRDVVAGEPHFYDYYAPFDAWLGEHHPQFESGPFVAGSSPSEAELHGYLTAAYAREWAAYLLEHGCTYDQGC